MFQNLTGIEYLKAEIACKEDKAYEKATWDERIAHYDTLDMSNTKMFKNASDPIGLRAASKAMDDAINAEPTGYMISLDACSSGLQILSLLVSCPTSFKLCGGDSSACIDSYVSIYDSMNLHGSLTRKQVKAAIMTSLYGSVAMPEMTFGDNVDLFYETMEAMAPGAWDLNMGLQELWDEVPAGEYSWVLPDNFHANIETKVKEVEHFTFLGASFELAKKLAGRPKFHKGLGPNLIHSIDGMVVREMYRRCMFSPVKILELFDALKSPLTELSNNSVMVHKLWEHFEDSGFLSVRILDYLDATNMGLVNSLIIENLLLSLPMTPFEIVSIHDCFRCHANNGNALRRQYNTIMADINDSTILATMADMVAGKSVKARKIGTIPRDEILNANYMLA